MAGQDVPTSGTIELEGEGIVSGHRARDLTRRGVALARQVPRPLGTLTVRENVAVGVRAGASRRSVTAGDRIDEILETTGLADKSERPAAQLPLLDLKRLEMARALSSDPRVLLLDEVSAGLNEKELDEAIHLIGRLHSGGTTLVIVEHVQRVVHELAQRVIVLNWGRLLTQGTPSEVTADERVQQVYLGAGRTAPRRTPTVAAQSSLQDGLSVRDLTVRRGMHRALEGVSIDIAPGQIVAALGANGAGKTTLAATVSGLVSAVSGVVMWAGQDITALPAHRRAAQGIAHCQEGRRLFAGLTVQENLLLGAYGVPAKERSERADAIYEYFPVLRDRRRQIGTTMSGGQQQMLAIGRALMSNPRLLMLDEVTLGLSPKVADEIYEAIERIASTGTSLLLVEQDADRCLDVAHRAYVLSHGRVAFEGPPSQLSHEQLVAAYLGGEGPPNNGVGQSADLKKGNAQ
jgi:branched-chain amino acid transport system ATP-binding protein